MAIARVFTHHTAPVNSLDFTKDGERLLSSAEDHRLCLYSSTQGTLERVAQCNAHGATLARFTHDPVSVIVASPMDHCVRYMSFHDNRYLRTFRAHTDEVVALEMSPKEDIFASASKDDTARLWDLRQANCAGVMRFQGGGHRPTVAFDPRARSPTDPPVPLRARARAPTAPRPCASRAQRASSSRRRSAAGA